jgi:hypothetical protein
MAGIFEISAIFLWFFSYSFIRGIIVFLFIFILNLDDFCIYFVLVRRFINLSLQKHGHH